jgi:Ca2+-binding RTX toxin-like protein
MEFNGANIAETFDVSANGGRVRFFRNVANITMDVNDVEQIDTNALGGADTATVHDLSGTDVTLASFDLAGTIGGTAGDGQPDTVLAEGTNGDDVVLAVGSGSEVAAVGLAAQVRVEHPEVANDRLTVNALAGDDVVEASSLSAGVIQLTANGGDGNDVLIGSAGPDVLNGEAGDDVLLGGPGQDVLDGAPGDDIVIQSIGADRVRSANAVGKKWLAAHAGISKGKTVLKVDGKKRVLPRAKLAKIAQGVTAS